jgi:hypothetical protein
MQNVSSGKRFTTATERMYLVSKGGFYLYTANPFVGLWVESSTAAYQFHWKQLAESCAEQAGAIVVQVL